MSIGMRTLRTTVTAAGIAALGVGFAGSAVAAPQAPEPGPEPASTLPAPASSPAVLLPDAQQLPPLPMLFVFEGPKVNTPTINTAGPGLVDRLA